MDQPPPSEPVSIPSNIDLEDKIAWGLTARQLFILGLGLLLLSVGYHASHERVPLLLFLVFAIPIAASFIALALARRDGLSLDRYLVAALRHLATTRRVDFGGSGHVHQGDGVRRPIRAIRLPIRDIANSPEFGVVDLGSYGLAALGAVSTVAWSLRSGREQDALVDGFARWLHSLAEPAQVLVRAVPLNLSETIAELDHEAAELGHPALTSAALDHADYLAELASEHDLYRRQIVLVFREPTSLEPTARPSVQARRDRAALNRLARKLADAKTLLGGAGLAVTPLDADQAAAVLTSSCRSAAQPDLGSAPAYDSRSVIPDHRPGGDPPDTAHETQPPPDYTADHDRGWYPHLPREWSR